jgi:AcrR family transcriptional regulator
VPTRPSDRRARARAARHARAGRVDVPAAILDAAFRIVAERGVRAVTTAAVGELAGYSRGIVNHQFGSRDGLMIRLAETAQARFTPNPPDCADGTTCSESSMPTSPPPPPTRA